jgi:hypothetical protein
MGTGICQWANSSLGGARETGAKAHSKAANREPPGAPAVSLDVTGSGLVQPAVDDKTGPDPLRSLFDSSLEEGAVANF